MEFINTVGSAFIKAVVDRRLLRGCPAAVDALVVSQTVITSDEVGLVCVIGHLVPGDQTT